MQLTITALCLLLAADGATSPEKLPAPHPRDAARYDADAGYEADAGFVPDAGHAAKSGFDAEAAYAPEAGADPRDGFDAERGLVRADRVARAAVSEDVGTVLAGVGAWFDALPVRPPDADAVARAELAAVEELMERRAALEAAAARAAAGDDAGALQSKRAATRHATLARRALVKLETLSRRAGAEVDPALEDVARRLDAARALLDAS